MVVLALLCPAAISIALTASLYNKGRFAPHARPDAEALTIVSRQATAK
jgi:hypothetical protein